MRVLVVAAMWLAVSMAVGPRSALAGEGLAERYPATMESSNEGLPCSSTSSDVWRLASFELGRGGDLSIRGKSADVVFGVHDTNVLWAVLFPAKPVKIESDLAGDGERTEAIFLRFSPYDLTRLFPKKTVKGPGSAALRARAARIASSKIGWRWCTPSGNSTIVPRNMLIVDADTDAEKRRFYAVNASSGSVEYVAEFESKPLPALAPITKDAALEVFDAVFDAFDREYAGFVLLPDLDWDKVGKVQRKLAAKQRTAFDTAAVISDLLAHLEDLHVWVKAGDDWLPGYTRERPLNANWQGTARVLGGLQQAGPEVHWGRTKDGIAYVNVSGLSNAETPSHVDAALEQLGDTWGLLLDLRFNGGGGEDLALEIAGRFLDEERVYSKNRYRAGSKHDALGPVLERRAGPRGPWRYDGPVVCLQGRKTMSSAESLALMLAQCPPVVTMGDATAGSSGNPRRLEPGHGIVVNLPRWLDMDPDENPIEHVGVAPDIAVETSATMFTPNADPVLDRALEYLRETPALEREPVREE